MRLAAAVLLAIALPATVVAAPAPRPADLRQDVEDAVLGSIHYGVFDSVGVTVHDGDVVLEGSVRRGISRSEIEKRVARVAGVRSVKNAIRIQSSSFDDDLIRAQLYRAIYGHTLLPHVATAEPVRIVVDHGRVTLTGFVSSRVEQVKVGMKARETRAFSVDNQVQLESERHAEAVRF